MHMILQLPRAEWHESQLLCHLKPWPLLRVCILVFGRFVLVHEHAAETIEADVDSDHMFISLIAFVIEEERERERRFAPRKQASHP
jgi:hypothetical protein